MITSIPKYHWGEIDEHGSIVYPLHAGQRDVIRSEARFTLACAGTGGGKTVTGPLWIMHQINKILAKAETDRKAGKLIRDFRKEPILGMVVAPTYPVLSRATAPTLVSMLQGTDLEGVYVPSQNKYYLPNDLGTIWTLSADNPGGLEGGQFDFVWGDEFGQAKYTAHVAIEGRTGKKQAPVLYTTTPYGMNWLYHKMVLPARAGDRNYYVRTWASVENPTYPREEYDRAKAGMSPQRGAQRYDGQFIKMAGLVYPDIDSCIVEPFSPPEGRKYGAIDFGFQDPFCCLCGALDRYDVLWVWFERYLRTTSLSDHAQEIPRDTQYWADPSRPDSIRDLRLAGHLVLPAFNDIVEGVDAVNNRIYTKRLRISRLCKAVAGEGAEYRYPEKDEEIHGEKPVDEFNHAMDTLRYLCYGIDRGTAHLQSR